MHFEGRIKLLSDGTFFNAQRFGATLQEMRRSAGYSNTEKLCNAVFEQTGIVINKDTLKKIERGSAPLDIDKFLAIVICLNDQEADHNFFSDIEYLVFNGLEGMPKLNIIEMRFNECMTSLEFIENWASEHKAFRTSHLEPADEIFKSSPLSEIENVLIPNLDDLKTACESCTPGKILDDLTHDEWLEAFTGLKNSCLNSITTALEECRNLANTLRPLEKRAKTRMTSWGTIKTPYVRSNE